MLTEFHFIYSVNSQVINNSEAFRQGVQCGDIIVGIEGNPIATHDEFMNVFTALGKPITIM